MPIYNNALAQRPSNQLAYQSTIGPVPRNEYLGALADFLAGSYSAERTQQMQGISKFLGVPAVSQTLDRLSYGEPLTTGAGGLGGTTRIRPEVLEAALTVAPLAQPVTMASLQAARAARQAAFATGRTLGPTAARMTEGYLQRQGLMPGVVPPSSKQFNVVNRDASEIFGAGAERLRYTDPASGGSIEVLKRPDNTASVLSLEVPEAFRGKGIGESLQAKVLQDFPEMQGQVSSKAAAKTAYRLGRRPPGQPSASLDDVYKIIDENSSVNLVSPEMQRSFMPAFQYPQEEAMRLAQQRAALPVEQGGLGLPAGNTAEQRAKAMGFTQDAYHGTPIFPGGLGDILKFNPNASVEMARRKPSLDTVGSWFSDNPVSAGMYEGGGYGAIYPVKINPGNVKETTFENMNRTAMRLAGESPKTGEYAKPNAVQAYKDWLDSNKINALSISHNPESPSTEFLNQVATVVRNSDDIRSRFAAFDPFRRSAAVAASMGVAAPDLLAAEAEQDAYARNELRKFKRQSAR